MLRGGWLLNLFLMFKDLNFYDFANVFLVMMAIAVLLIGFIDGVRNIRQKGKAGEKTGYKAKIIDFIFGIDIYILVFFGLGFLLACIAKIIGSYGAMILGLYVGGFLPWIIVFISGVLLFLKPFVKYKYILTGILATGVFIAVSSVF
jgi:hypothetical protein